MIQKSLFFVLLFVIATLPMGCIGNEEITPLVIPPLPSAFPSFLTNVNGTLFFMANDGVHGVELWKSDGTGPGTLLVKDINPGVGNASPTLNALAAVNGILFFWANDGVHGVELWKSDGTAAGTVLVKDINPSGNSIPASPSSPSLVDVSGMLFFTANDGVHGVELWKSDGTAAGTVLVKDINPDIGDAGPSILTPMSNTLFFVADDGVTGRELWTSDGTPGGTVLVKDIAPGPGDSFPTSLVVMNSILYFAAYDGLQANGAHGRELWKSDGTEVGTVIVKDINTDVNVKDGWSSPSFLINVSGTLFFSANDGFHKVGLWKSDGTDTGSSWITEFAPLGADPGILYFAALNGDLFFEANNGADGVEFWTSDGTALGTVMVRDINAGPGNSGPAFLTVVNNALFFTANDGAHGVELWKSDGTNTTCDSTPGAGTCLVRDIRLGSVTSNPFGFTAVNGILYFSADDGANGNELWRSDGTTAGTFLVRNINQ